MKNDFEYITYDQNFIIKRISKKYKKFFIEKFIKEYHTYLGNPNFKQTFLPNIIGLFTITLGERSFSFLLLENPFCSYNIYKISKTREEESFESNILNDNILAYYRLKPTKSKKIMV